MDELTVEVHKSEEGLDVLNFPQFRPIGDGLNFLRRYGESVGRKTETEVLSGGGMELTFLWLGEEIVLSEALEDFVDVFLMGLEVLGVYQDVIQIDNNADIKEIREDTIDESLKGCRSICQAEGHDIPLEGTIRCAVSCTKYVWYHGHRDHVSCVPKTEELFQEHFYRLRAPGVEEEEDCRYHPTCRLL